MIIRKANPADASHLVRLLEQLEHPLDITVVREKIHAYKLANYHLLVSEVNNQVIGFASLHWYDVFYSPGYVGRITAFCIDEKFRSKGLGRTLLQAVEEFFKTRGCIRIEVSSNERRSGAHQFYLSNGYIINSKRFIKPIAS